MTLRWGVAGPGRIAATVAPEFALVPGAELVAVGSRLPERAADFAGRFGTSRSCGSHDDLLAADVDAIDLSTPHALHTELAPAAIEAGKAVLIEKAFGRWPR